jgi:hypothetical protein
MPARGWCGWNNQTTETNMTNGEKRIARKLLSAIFNRGLDVDIHDDPTIGGGLPGKGYVFVFQD